MNATEKTTIIILLAVAAGACIGFAAQDQLDGVSHRVSEAYTQGWDDAYNQGYKEGYSEGTQDARANSTSPPAYEDKHRISPLSGARFLLPAIFFWLFISAAIAVAVRF